MYFEQQGNYRTDIPQLLGATSGFPLDIRLMHSCLVVSPMDLSQRERHLQEILKHASPTLPWPFVNHPEPLTPRQLGGVGVNGGRGCHDSVKFADQGTMYVYLEEDGDVRIQMQCWGMQDFRTMH